MLRRWRRSLTAGTAGFLLLAGCVGPRERTDTGAPESEAQENKLAEAHAHYAQALLYDLNGDEDKALEEYTRSAQEDPSNEKLVLDLARQYTEAKQPEKALELLKKAADVPGASAAVFSELSLVYARLGKDADAAKTAELVIKRDPSSLSGYQDLFIVDLERNRAEEALKVLDRASKAPGADTKFLIDLAGLYASLQIAAPSVKAEAVATGMALLKKAVPPEPADPQLLEKRADAYNLLGAETNAAAIYLGLLDKYGSLPTLRNTWHAKLAELYLRGHDSKKAEEQLQDLLRDDPANSQAYYYLGSLAYDEKKLPEAIDYFQKSLAAKDDFEQAYYDLAGAQINNGEPKEALETLDRARGKFATNFLGEFFTALAYVKLKDYTNAVSHFATAETCAKAAGTHELNAYFYFQAGAACERNGEIQRAEEYFEKSLKLTPDMAEALNYYGYMLADRGEKLDKARVMIEKAVQLDPRNAAYLDSLGWVLYKLGKSEEALVQEQKSIDLSDDPDPTLFDHLGDIYAALKEPDKAREAWKKSLALEPNDDVKKKLGSDGGQKN